MGGLKEAFYRVLAILYRYSEEVAVIDYPDRIEKRSLDVAVRIGGGRVLLLKIADDIVDVPKSEVNELKGLGAAMGLPAGIIATKRRGRELAPYVAYERQGLPVVSPESLEEYLRSGGAGIYAYQSRDSIRVKIDSEALKRAREALGLSLGDVASFLGVSRKMVYQYEKGMADPTLDKAEKLASLLGEKVIESWDPFKEPPRPPASHPPFDEEGEEALAMELARRGLKVFHAKKTAADITASAPPEPRIVIAYQHRREPLPKLVDRVDNIVRLSRVAESKPIAVVEGREEEAELSSIKGVTLIRRSRRVSLDELLGEEATDNREAGGR
ncbi:MAG: helix-turn-helix domain-containing protein [Desulfurococcales archaeon]|nr:helix-turn-helix domain-containing protein [Desulfurococcales archaeon]